MLIDEVINLGKNNGDKVCILDHNKQKYTWSDYIKAAIEISSSLNKLNLEPSEKVLIVCQNKLKFFFIALSCIYSNLTFIPYYLKNLDDDIQIIYNVIIDQKCNVIFSDDLELLKKINLNSDLNSKEKKIINKISKLNKIYTLNDNSTELNNNNLKFYDWNTFINLSNEEYISPVKNNLNQVVFTLCSYKLLSKEDICYIQFTEEQINDQIDLLLGNYGFSNESLISLFPLSNIITILFDFFLHFKSNSLVYLINTLNILNGDLLIKVFKEVRPTVLYLVPYLWFTLKDRIDNDIKLWKSYTLIGCIIMIIRYINLRYYKLSITHPFLDIFIKFFHYSISIFCNFFLSFYGLNKCHRCFNILDYLNKEYLKYFAEIDIPIYQIASQNACYGIFSLSNKVEFDNVGFPLKQLKISDSQQMLLNIENSYNKLVITNNFGEILSNQKLVLYPNCQENLNLDILIYFYNKVPKLEKIKLYQIENDIKAIFIVFEDTNLLINNLIEEYNKQILMLNKKIINYQILFSHEVHKYRDEFFRINNTEFLLSDYF